MAVRRVLGRDRVDDRYQSVTIPGPTKGIDLRPAQTALDPRQARMLVNVTLREPETLVVRDGWTRMLSAGPPIIQGGRRIYLRATVPSTTSYQQMLIARDGAIYTISDSGAFAIVYSGMSTSALVEFVSDQDMVAAFHGSSMIVKSTNGSSWTRFGIPRAFATVPTLSTLSTGGLSSGEYQLDFTYKDRDLLWESNGGVGSTITLSASSGAIRVVVPNSTDPQVDAVVVYARKVTAGETVLRKVSSVALGTGSSTLVVTSTAWTVNAEIPTDHDPPPALDFGVVWKNRWWGLNGNRLHFSQLFQPQAWPPTFNVVIPFRQGDEARAIVALGDVLLIFGSIQIFVVHSDTALNFEIRPALASEDGALGPRAVAVLDEGVLHGGASGVYLFDGTRDRLWSANIGPGWMDLIGNVAAAQLRSVAMVYDSRDKEVRIAVPRRYPSGAAGEWVLDMTQTRIQGGAAWTSTDRDVGGYIPWDGPEVSAGNHRRLWSWNSTNASLYEENVGETANGAAMVASYEGPEIAVPSVLRARWIDVRGEYEPRAGSVALEPTVDGQSQGTQIVPLGANLSVYGTALYGSGTYTGAGRRQFHRHMPLSADGRTFALTMTYTGPSRWRLFRYDVGMVPEAAPRAFSE